MSLSLSWPEFAVNVLTCSWLAPLLTSAPFKFLMVITDWQCFAHIGALAVIVTLIIFSLQYKAKLCEMFARVNAGLQIHRRKASPETVVPHIANDDVSCFMVSETSPCLHRSSSTCFIVASLTSKKGITAAAVEHCSSINSRQIESNESSRVGPSATHWAYDERLVKPSRHVTISLHSIGIAVQPERSHDQPPAGIPGSTHTATHALTPPALPTDCRGGTHPQVNVGKV